MPQLSSNFDQYSFSDFTEAFLLMHRRGMTLTVADAVAAFPQLEAEIRERLPALLAIEEAVGKELADEEAEEEPTSNYELPGIRFGNELGRGSFGVVYRAFQSELQRDVAVKVMPFRGREEANERFRRECKAMARLEHPNIAPVYSFVTTATHAYLVMKFIDGYSFQDLLEGRSDYKGSVLLSQLRSDWREFAELAVDVLKGLEHMHQQGLVHRDIKPSNLMLDKTGKIWITDFGLAKIFDTSDGFSRTGDVVGTPRYMAPEQLHGTCDERSDIYSLGLTLYEIATGVSARQAIGQLPSTESTAFRVSEQNHQSLPECLVEVIRKACSFSPEDRYQTATELRVVLQRFIDGQRPDRRKKKRKPDSVFRQEHRKKMIASIVGVSLFCAIGGAFWAVASYPTKTVASATPAGSQLGLLQRMADNPEADIVEHFQDALKDTLHDEIESIGLNEEEKDVLVDEIDGLMSGLEEGTIHPYRLEQVISRYQQSGLATATRIMRVGQLLERSGLDFATREQGQKTLRAYAWVVMNGRLSEQEALTTLDQLTFNKHLTYEELLEAKIPDKRLAAWIVHIDNRLAQIGYDNPNVTGELQNIFEELDRPLTEVEKQLAAQRFAERHAEHFGSPDAPRQLTEEQKAMIEQRLETLPPEYRQQLLQHLQGAPPQ